MSSENFNLTPFDGRYGKKVTDEFGEDNLMVRYHPGICLLPPFYSDIEKEIFDAHVRESDVWLISFPRTGSTWCQEMIWLIANNLDYDTAQNTVQQVRAPLIESPAVLFQYVDDTDNQVNYINNVRSPQITRGFLPYNLLPTPQDNGKTEIKCVFTDPVGFVEDLPSPRCMKSHLPVELLPKKLMTVKPKIIYTMRNPKDLCVSYYHHCKMVHRLNVDFETFCELFLNDAIPMGSVFNHYFGFWNRRHEPNILIVRYEEMKNDTKRTVKKLAEFMQKSLTDEDLDALCEFLSFQNMRQNRSCNLQVFVDSKLGDNYYEKTGTHFIRKGIVGDYKNHMSPEMIERFDKWIEENTRGTDLTF